MKDWIKVEDRLPEVGEKVLFYNSDFNEYQIGWADNIEGVLCVATYMGYCLTSDSKFSHWQKLPNPPRV